MKLDTTKYNNMVANASASTVISSAVFKAFIADVKAVVDANDDLKLNLAGGTMTGDLVIDSLFAQVGEATSGQGGQVRYKADSGNVRYLTGFLGSAGATDFNIYDTIASANRFIINSSGRITMPSGDLWLNTVRIFTGTGTPEGIVTAPIGSLFLRTDGAATTTLYVKTLGVGNTGWTAK
jgi:hypothetical protein